MKTAKKNRSRKKLLYIMEIFPNVKGPLTPPSEIKSGRNSNSNKILGLTLLLHYNEEVCIKNEAAGVDTILNIYLASS